METYDSAGGHRTSASYSSDGSLGLVSDVANVAAPAVVVKSGYLGQLYEVTAVQLAATPTTLNETSTRQLAASATLDDGTTLAALANALTWSVVGGPITGISSSGLATAGNVYQNTAATVQGSYFGSSGTLGLTVVNVGADDLGLYAGDGIDDPWQVQYFGLGNGRAAPGVFSDGSGLTNLFKFTAGLVPNNSASAFVNSTAAITGQPTKKSFSFGPIVAGRSYTVEFTDTLQAGSWGSLTGFSTSDNGSTRTVTDNAAPSTRRFYRVVITKP